MPLALPLQLSPGFQRRRLGFTHCPSQPLTHLKHQRSSGLPSGLVPTVSFTPARCFFLLHHQ